MKKILLLVAFLGATFIGAKAQQQTILAEQDFEGTVTGWGSDNFSTQDPVLNPEVKWQIYNANNFTDIGLPTKTIASTSFTTSAGGTVSTPYEASNFIYTKVTIPASDVEQLVVKYERGTFGNDDFSGTLLIGIFDGVTGNIIGAIEDSVFEGQVMASEVSFNLLEYDFEGENLLGRELFMGILHDGKGNIGLGYMVVDNIKIYTTSVASTEDFQTASFSIYPNPATDVINISNSFDVIENVKITDLNGRIVKEIALDVEKAQINISDLAQGVYILNATSNGRTVTEKIVKK